MEAIVLIDSDKWQQDVSVFSFSYWCWYSSKVAMIKTIPKWAIFIPQDPSSYVSHIVLSFPSFSDFFCTSLSIWRNQIIFTRLELSLSRQHISWFDPSSKPLCKLRFLPISLSLRIWIFNLNYTYLSISSSCFTQNTITNCFIRGHTSSMTAIFGPFTCGHTKCMASNVSTYKAIQRVCNFIVLPLTIFE